MSEENFKFGIEITGTDSINSVTKALVELDTELEKKIGAFSRLGGAIKQSGIGDYSREITRVTAGTDQATDNITGNIKKITGDADVARVNAEALNDALTDMGEPTFPLSAFDKLIGKTTVVKESTTSLQDAISEINTDTLTSEINQLTDALPDEEVNTLARNMKQLKAPILDVEEAFKSQGKGINAMRQMYRRTGQDIFWLGLGTMFLVISYQRLKTAAKSVTQSQRSLESTMRDSKSAQQEYMEAVALYGASSKEAVEANNRYKDSTDSLTTAQENLQYNLANQQLTMLSLALGTAPTMIRAVFSMTDMIWRYNQSLIMARMGVNAHTASVYATQPAMVKAAGGISLFNAGLFKTTVLLGLATAGITTLIGLLASLAIESSAEAQMKKFSSSIDVASDSIDGHSLVSSLQHGEAELRNFGEEVDKVNQLTIKDVDVKTGRLDIPTATNLATIRPIQADITRAGGIRDVNITFGDLTIREEADIDKIVKKVSKSMGKEVVNLSGGRTFV